jgi:hypothetical protein
MPIVNAFDRVEQPMSQVVEAWGGRLARAREHREPWDAVASECQMFYSAVCGFLFDPKYRARFWGANDLDPTFRITLARAFEVVALYSPNLYWDNPVRRARPTDFIAVPPEMFGDLQNDPQAQMLFQQEQQRYQAEAMQRNMAAALQERILNKTPDLLGLHEEARQGVIDMLLTGRGILKTEPARQPGSSKLLVGSFNLNPMQHFVDPDCQKAKDAYWQIEECHAPYWQVEREFRLYPQGVLRNAATHESGNQQGAMWGDSAAGAANNRLTGHSKDELTYYKVYSRMGIGLQEMDGSYQHPYAVALDRIVGDYAYFAIAPGVPYFLNCPDWVFQQASVEEIRARFAWPITFWTEGKWPYSFLDAYPQNRPDDQRRGYPYPLSCLAPGLGELKAINLLMASLLNQSWMSGRTIAAVMKSAAADVEKALTSLKDFAVIGLDQVSEDLNKIIQFVEFRSNTTDRYQVIAMLAQALDRRWGVNELLYGQSGESMPRSATDVQARQSNTSIRPQDLGRRVKDWQRDVARREAYGLWYATNPQDHVDHLGQAGAAMWGKFVKSQSGERVIRQIDYQVEAENMQRPDRARDGENLRNFMQAFAAPMQLSLQAGNVEPVNALIDLFGQVSGMKVDQLKLQPPPPPDPSQSPEMQAKQAEIQLEQAKAQLQAQIDQMKAQQDLETARQKFAEQMREDQEKHQQEMRQDQEKHRQEMFQAAQEAVERIRVMQLEVRQKEREGDVKIEQARRMALAKPKTNGSNNRG